MATNRIVLLEAAERGALSSFGLDEWLKAIDDDPALLLMIAHDWLLAPCQEAVHKILADSPYSVPGPLGYACEIVMVWCDTRRTNIDPTPIRVLFDALMDRLAMLQRPAREREQGRGANERFRQLLYAAQLVIDRLSNLARYEMRSRASRRAAISSRDVSEDEVTSHEATISGGEASGQEETSDQEATSSGEEAGSQQEASSQEATSSGEDTSAESDIAAVATSEPVPRKCRIVLHSSETAVSLDGEPIGVKPKQYELLALLIGANGEYVSLGSGDSGRFRSRDVESLPEPLKSAIDAQPGAGTRIKPEYWLN